jgi:hypothetical protein
MERPDLAKPLQPPKDMTAVVVPSARLGEPAPSTPDLGSGQRVVVSVPGMDRAEERHGVREGVRRDVPDGVGENDPDAYSDEKPAHPVKLSDYWIGKYEVSNAQYRKKEPGTRGHVRWGKSCR